jgi:hypothetical protein
MDSLLRSHRIPVEAIRSDDFETFYTNRKAALLNLIESVMGKSLSSAMHDDPEDEEDQMLQ